MTVKDYALELSVTSNEVLSKLKELGYSYKNENDYLDDEYYDDEEYYEE